MAANPICSDGLNPQFKECAFNSMNSKKFWKKIATPQRSKKEPAWVSECALSPYYLPDPVLGGGSKGGQGTQSLPLSNVPSSVRQTQLSTLFFTRALRTMACGLMPPTPVCARLQHSHAL